MLQRIERFFADTSGAVTVDFVVLTASVVGLMFAALSVFLDVVTDHADLTSETMLEREVGTGF